MINKVFCIYYIPQYTNQFIYHYLLLENIAKRGWCKMAKNNNSELKKEGEQLIRRIDDAIRNIKEIVTS